jgi:hypothetical protein
MRSLQASILAAALLAPVTAAHAQSAYDYPWCAVYTGNHGPGGAMSCYYASYGQCMQTMSGIGGHCIRSPYYGHGPDQRSQRRGYRDY